LAQAAWLSESRAAPRVVTTAFLYHSAGQTRESKRAGGGASHSAQHCNLRRTSLDSAVPHSGAPRRGGAGEPHSPGGLSCADTDAMILNRASLSIGKKHREKNKHDDSNHASASNNHSHGSHDDGSNDGDHKVVRPIVDWQELSERLMTHEKLGPLLESLAGVVLQEAEFCRGMLTALRDTPTVMEMPLDDNAKAAVTGFLETQKKARMSKAAEFDSIAKRFSFDNKDRCGGDGSKNCCKEGDTAISEEQEEDEEPGLPWFPAPSYGSWRRRVFVLFELPSASNGGRAFHAVLLLTILVSTIAFVMESMPTFRSRPAECARSKPRGWPLQLRLANLNQMDGFGLWRPCALGSSR